MKIQSQTSLSCLELRRLETGDAIRLAVFFESLSEDSRAFFYPHPLNKGTAFDLCKLDNDSAMRFILEDPIEQSIAGYFILDFKVDKHEAERYRNYDVDLFRGRNAMLDLVVSERYRRQGFAYNSLQELLVLLEQTDAEQVILRDGCLSQNQPAIGLFTKCGFNTLGSYWTVEEHRDMCLKMSEVSINRT
ncbi:GNAT family N-acetyltransferase [Alginatibacterium sediminis]|uniref:GNAT family N-acetyltransferase n=1 Tax=Alginatibacterium sediminis TaxID=2164068 RepID=A0A420ENC4_9ALTE|nr:GNAT family N-acetyltransferase [Alginatibacterium sediminis]RKF22168.1 GNAT family N-acetyltransferase [Alginatibacterium sediminis]